MADRAKDEGLMRKDLSEKGLSEEAVNARVRAAKARLALLAAQADAEPSPVERVAYRIRSSPWRGVGVALLAGLALGVGRKRALPILAPMLVPALRRVAGGGPGTRRRTQGARRRRFR